MHLAVFFSSVFDHVSTSQRSLLSSSLFLQTTVFTSLILFTLPSNTGHQKMLLPEQVDRDAQMHGGIFLTLTWNQFGLGMTLEFTANVCKGSSG